MPLPRPDAPSAVELIHRHDGAIRDLTRRLHELEHRNAALTALLRDVLLAGQEPSPYARIDRLKPSLAALDALLHGSCEK